MCIRDSQLAQLVVDQQRKVDRRIAAVPADGLGYGRAEDVASVAVAQGGVGPVSYTHLVQDLLDNMAVPGAQVGRQRARV